MQKSPNFKNKLDTPCLLLDIDILKENIQKMQKKADKQNKKLRPHAKTHKCSALAKMQIEAGAIGICAAKVSEATVLGNNNIQNILITGPVVTQQKIDELLKIVYKIPSTMLVVDNIENIKTLSSAFKMNNLILNVFLDIDVGLERTGCNLNNVYELSNIIASTDNLSLKGIQAYAGHLQHIKSYIDRKKASLNCLLPVADLFKNIKNIIPECSILSTSGTGTFEIDSEIPEITEFQVGSYTVMDAEYYNIESINNNSYIDFNPSLSILTTVISNNKKEFVTVDAGLKSIYKDGDLPYILSPEFVNCTYDWFGDEYGKITSTYSTGKLPKLTDVLELVVSHCDPTINLFNNYYITKEDKVIDKWCIDLRGCSQ